MLALPLKILAAGYLAASLLSFCRPPLRRRVPPQSPLAGGGIWVVAHRGSPRQRVENTVESFECSLGTSDMLEMDVCETKDGELVVHHDLDLLRSCGVRGQVKEYDLGELPGFKEEVEVQFAEEGRVTRRRGESIPTLR